MKENYESLLKFFFNDFDVKYYDDEYLIYKETIAMKLIIENNIIYLKELNKSNISATSLLEDLILFATTNDFEYIRLDDQSYINAKLEDGEDVKLDLAALNILSFGESWYNRMRFRQENYNEDIIRWNNIRNKTFIELLDEFGKLTDKDIETKGYYDSAFTLSLQEDDDINELQYIVNIVLENEYLLNTKTKDIASIIYSNLKSNKDVQRIELVYISLISYILKYEREDLRYYIN